MYYSINGTGNLSTVTAASAGIIKLENSQAVGAAMSSAGIAEFSIGPFSSASDNNYAIALKRQSTTGVWAQPGTGNALDKGTVSAASGWFGSTTAGTAGATLLTMGFNARGGLRWVALPGASLCLPLLTGAGIRAEFVFAQSTDLMCTTMIYEE